MAKAITSVINTVLKSKLFGHKKGAFTDAHEDRVRLFKTVEGGTIFLDEIGNISLPYRPNCSPWSKKRPLYRWAATKAFVLIYD
ncbi:MAG: sigma-54 factor interaction domain-containing protein [Cyclobacteriaceae bacterium]|nr:sigma-54 factor interaction domain-containing protein [Cyclobacteriaceae bacterium]